MATMVKDTSVADPASTNKEKNAYEEEDRDSWSGRISFWLAAVGSAVGLGNLWRFPWQCAKWGGGAFIFAYFVALFTLGMPLLTQELALGQKHRSGDIEAFGRMNWRLRGIGLASVIGGFGIVTYYMMIIGVSAVFFFESFISPLPYGGSIEDGSSYWTTIVGVQPFEDSEVIINGKLFLATTLCWVLTFICIMKGVKSASWAVKFTMPLPFLFLVILLIKGLTLDGAWNGIKTYWDFSNWDELGSSGIWNAAIGQCFFSLSVCMGVMTAYGSYNPIRQDIATDEKVIAFLDVFASLMSGFVVYAILGYLVYESGDNSWFETASVGLVFEAFPVGIATFAGANFFGIIFYLTLVMLGIDSAFSIVEAISTVIVDSDLNIYRLKWSRTKVSAVLCVVGAFGSSLYCFDTGLLWLDIVDHYINNYGMIFLGICEAGACGWFYSYHKIEEKIGVEASTLYRLGFWISLIFACTLSFSLATPEQAEVDGPYLFTGGMGQESWIVGFCVGIAGWALSVLLAYMNRSQYARKNLSFGQTMWYIIGWENVEVLRDFMNCNGLGDAAWTNNKHTLKGELHAGIHHSSIGIWWGFLIKYWLPAVLTVTLIGTMRDNIHNPYGGYDQGSLAVGVLFFVAMVLTVVFVAFFPQYMTQAVDESGVYDNLDKKVVEMTIEEEEDEDDEELKKKDKSKEDADKKYDALVNKKEDIELAEEVNPEKAKENQSNDNVVEEEEGDKDTETTTTAVKAEDKEEDKGGDDDKEKSDFID